MPRRLAPLALSLIIAACASPGTSPTADSVDPTSEPASPSPSEQVTAPPSEASGTDLADFTDALSAIVVSAPADWVVASDTEQGYAGLSLLDAAGSEYQFGENGELTVLVAQELAPAEGNDADRLAALIGRLADISARDEINAICTDRGSTSLGTDSGNPVARGTAHLAYWGVADTWADCGTGGGTIVELIGAPQEFAYAFYALLVLPTADDAEMVEQILSSLEIDPAALP